jgi:hypothetical protein
MKRVLRVFKSKEEADAADADFWLHRPVSERIAAVEKLREFHHGSSARMARVLVVTQRSARDRRK